MNDVLFYFVALAVSPFLGVIITYKLFFEHEEVVLIMIMGAFLATGFASIAIPFYWLLTL